MCVHGNARVLLAWHKAFPVGQILECIMYESNYVALLAGWKAEPKCIVITDKPGRVGGGLYRMLL